MRKDACQDRLVTIQSSDLPLCCPMPNQQTWCAHPRVYLSLDDQGRAVCPYCSTVYQLEDTAR